MHLGFIYLNQIISTGQDSLSGYNPLQHRGHATESEALPQLLQALPTAVTAANVLIVSILSGRTRKERSIVLQCQTFSTREKYQCANFVGAGVKRLSDPQAMVYGQR